MSGERPADSISIEEWRILVASVAGPRRIQLSSFVPFNVSATVRQLVASNASAPSLYVEVRHLSGPTVIFLGTSKNLSAENAKRVDLADEFFVGTVLMVGEELWIGSPVAGQAVATRVQVGKIQV